MFSSTNRRIIVSVWLATVAALAGIGALSGVALTFGTSLLWIAAGVVPPGIMLMVWQGAPPPTVAEILHTAERRE